MEEILCDIIFVEDEFVCRDRTGNLQHETLDLASFEPVPFPAEPNVEITTPAGEIETTFLGDDGKMRTKSMRQGEDCVIFEAISAKVTLTFLSKEGMMTLSGGFTSLRKNITTGYLKKSIREILEKADKEVEAVIHAEFDFGNIKIVL